MAPDRERIEQEKEHADVRAADRSLVPHMTYEQGVADALAWVLGLDADPPLGM